MTRILCTHSKDNGNQVIIVEDDGNGVSYDNKKQLFTKGFGKNTSLGLFLIREILSITVISITENGEPGKGARFEMMVPNGMWRFVLINDTNSIKVNCCITWFLVVTTWFIS
jgi:sensor histidine kinase regulating citrate/malate metabolism